VDKVTGETRLIPSTWERERVGHVLQNIPDLTVLRLQAFVFRWTVSALDVLLFDEDSPYRHFTIVPYFPLLRSGRTIGLVENQIGPQETINKMTSQEQHVVNTTANSGWKVRKNSLQNMDVYELETRGAETGLVVEVSDMDALEKIQPNPIPQGLDRIGMQARQDMFEVSLVNKSQLGVDREDVSGKAMERKQLRGPINIGKALANLVRSEHLLARNTTALVQAFYTEERALRVTRKERGRDITVDVVLNQMTPEGNLVNDVTLGEYNVISSTVSLREQHEDTEFDQAVALREQGVDISDEELVALSRLRNKKEILERQQAEAQDRAGDVERERALKQAELEKMQTDVQAAKTGAQERIARAQHIGEETKQLMLEKQAELAKIATQLQLAQNDARRLELEAEELRLKERELMLNAANERRKLRLESKPKPKPKTKEAANA